MFLVDPQNCFDPIKFHDDINFEGGGGDQVCNKTLQIPN
jgi:hypothetical protein